MLDGIDARANGSLGALGAVSVSGGLLSQRVRLVDDGVQFVLGELRNIRRIRQATARRRSRTP